MTREDAIDNLEELWNEVYNEDSDGYDYAVAIDMAIEALSAEPSGDLISRADTVKMLLSFKQSRAESVSSYDMGFVDGLSHAINIIDLVPLVYIPSINIIDLAPSAETLQGWIPFTRRPMTEEEQKDYPNCTFMFDCVLPDDGDEILVSNWRFVWMDTFCSDIDGCYLDSGDDIGEDMAWMPLPKPYKGGDVENENNT